MTGYSSSSRKKRQGWQNYQVKKSWRSLLSIVITITLTFAIISGISKSFSIKSKIGGLHWDGKSTFALVFNTINPSVFVYQPDSKQMVVLTISPDTNYETGDKKNPLAQISKKSDSNGVNFSASMSHVYGAKIDNYIYFKDITKMDEIFARKVFADFASVSTPFKLITGGWGKDVKQTNITRGDAFRLWWQIKDLRVNSLKIADLSDKTQIINASSKDVLGADTASLNREISKYLQNLSVVNDGFKVLIKNASGADAAGALAYTFIDSVGVKVVNIENSANISASTAIFTSRKSYTASYLAKIFNCDIKDALEEPDYATQIVLVLGQDFAMRYFK